MLLNSINEGNSNNNPVKKITSKSSPKILRKNGVARNYASETSNTNKKGVSLQR